MKNVFRSLGKRSELFRNRILTVGDFCSLFCIEERTERLLVYQRRHLVEVGLFPALYGTLFSILVQLLSPGHYLSKHDFFDQIAKARYELIRDRKGREEEQARRTCAVQIRPRAKPLVAYSLAGMLQEQLRYENIG